MNNKGWDLLIPELNRYILYLKCINCEKEYEFGRIEYNCPSCKNNLWVYYNYKKIKISRKSLNSNKVTSIARYLPILPNEIYPFTIQIGWTPLHKAEKLSSELNVKLYLKNDTLNPSASLKDRASAVVISVGVEKNKDVFTTASTGNAGCALACLCANVSRKCVIFVPETTPEAKLTQLSIFGAKIIKVKGNYDDAFDLSLKATEKYSWYCRSTGFNPYTREGKKTVAFEISEQLNFKVPDYVFVPVGDGNIISGVYKGFYDFLKLELIDKIPKIVGVQSTNSNAIYKAYQNYKKTKKIEIQPVKSTTIADSISVDLPRDGFSAVYSIINSNGFAIEVTDEEILNAVSEISKKEGIFAEPAGATSFAGLRKSIEKKLINSNSTVVCLITGSGLKDIKSAQKIKGDILTIENNIKELEKIKV